MQVEFALPSDTDQILTLIQEVSAWLRTVGILQWTDYPRESLETAIASKEVFLLKRQDFIIATVSLTKQNPEFWAVPNHQAIYMHRLAIHRSYWGQKLGRGLVHWAEAECRRRGLQLLRLDCAAVNTKLRAYYQSLGFDFIKISHDVAYEMDLALFEKKL